ncbi:MAG: hypothetical protein ITG07_05770 [Candidimonas sp.]|nr:hypothetical protein [Candidimonas sp.]
MQLIDHRGFDSVTFGDNVKIFASRVEIGDGVIIESDVTIQAENIFIGDGVRIERGTTIRGIGGAMELLELGDYVFVGFSNQILAPKFIMKDYSQLHNSCLCSGYKELVIGYNCWVGQGSILNCTDFLQIDNNVRIGTGSQLWTHVASGELLEGCTLYGSSPLHLKDNVWIVGGAVVSPGLVLESNSIVMTGAVLTKNTEAFHTYAGVPAKDVSSKINFWKDVSVVEKFKMMEGFILEFYSEFPQYKGQVHLLKQLSLKDVVGYSNQIFISSGVDFELFLNGDNSIFDISTKRYIKIKSALEVAWIKFNVGFRSRFTPCT